MPVRGAQVAHVHAMHLRSWCHVAPSTSPTSPAPQPRANAHMLRHGKLRPRHPLPHRFHVHRPFLVAAGRTKPGSTRKGLQLQQEKCHVGMAAAEKRARLKSAFMAASTESLSPLRPACRAPVGRSAPASLLLVGHEGDCHDLRELPGTQARRGHTNDLPPLIVSFKSEDLSHEGVVARPPTITYCQRVRARNPMEKWRI